MLAFYPEFEAQPVTDYRAIILMDMSNSMADTNSQSVESETKMVYMNIKGIYILTCFLTPATKFSLCLNFLYCYVSRFFGFGMDITISIFILASSTWIWFTDITFASEKSEIILHKLNFKF